MMNSHYIIIVFLTIGFILSCTKDKVEVDPAYCIEEVNYIADVKEIIDNTCAFSECHVSGNNVPGNFTSYNGLLSYLNEDQFEARVLRVRDMPPNYSSGPKFLTEEQLELITCWVQQEYPEN